MARKKVPDASNSPRTVTDNLRESAGHILDLLDDLLLNHSSIYLWNRDEGPFVFMCTQGDYAYRELAEEGRQLQAQVLDEYRRFHALLAVLLRGQPQDSLRELSDANSRVVATIEQEPTWCKSTREALDKARADVESQLALMARLYDCSCGQPTYVPDTNALLVNPDLDSWVFPETTAFTLVLLSTVLSELDTIKVDHRNEDVRKRAENLIRRIKEYRRRGKLSLGVSLVKGRVSLQAVALEPDMDASLPWLDPNNKDDRILAGIIEVMRTRPRSPVVAVSRDINFQNKAEYANIPFEEPPARAEK